MITFHSGGNRKGLPLHHRPAIDAHVHIHPNQAEAMTAVMEANGLAASVNLGILEALDIPFEEGMRVFREVRFAKVLAARMVYFPTPDFRDTAPGFGERMAQALERKVEAGACGLKIFKELGLRHKDADGKLIPVDDPRLDPLWATAGELGVPVLIHTADPVAFFRPLDEHNERWEELQTRPDWHFGRPGFPDFMTLLAQLYRVVARHPATPFISTHMGNFAEDLAYVDACLDRYPNLYVDTTARIGEFGRHPAAEVRAFFLKHQDRILFGTDLTLGWGAFEDHGSGEEALARSKLFYDAHWRYFETDERQIEYPGYPIQGRWKVDAIGLPDDVLEKLYVGNARRIIRGL
jgi:hypothetical protein